MSEYRLSKEIIALSKSKNWEQAKREWELVEVFEEDVPGTCLCGHFPIIENCIISNRETNNNATVGNCCVKKFLNLPSDDIFKSIKKVRKDETASMSGSTIDFANEKGWITDWEYNFYCDIFRKRSLSDRQIYYKVKVNQKIMGRLKRSNQNK